jgi:cellulose synthase/poly-beta-1,6-N-acetylglucosamine synthase-like glycosyltransferase
MARAIPEVTTEIIVFADDDVTWPPKTLRWMLAPFEDEKYGGVVTCQRLRRAESPSFSQRIYGFLGALYLERRNFDCAATTHMDGGVPCLSGRTVAYRAEILQDKAFTSGFTDEKWWFGQYQLNADDDNFITRWMVSHGKETYMQYHPECEVQTTLEDNPKFLKQCLRWARSNWRSNLSSMFVEKHIWRYVTCPPTPCLDGFAGFCNRFESGANKPCRKQPWSTYAVHLTTLSPPAIVGDFALVAFLWQATASWPADEAVMALQVLISWMLFSKFVKLIPHFARYPIDILLWPVSILFGWFHGGVKYYALATLSEVSTINFTQFPDADSILDHLGQPRRRRCQ